MYKTAQQILDLNDTDLPISFAGVARGGTTFLQRSVWRQQIINNPENPIAYVDEGYRILPGHYELDFSGELPMMKSSLFKGQDSMSIAESFMFPLHASNQKIVHPYIRERIGKFKEVPFENVNNKMFPVDFMILAQHDIEWSKKVLQSNFYVNTIRKDWLAALLSFFYAANIKQFHHYEGQEFEKKEVWFNPLLVKNTIKQQTIAHYDLFSSEMPCKYIYTDELYDMEDNIEDWKKAVEKVPANLRRYIDVGIEWHGNPVILDKKPVYENYVTNYESFCKKAQRVMESWCEYTKGFFYLDGDNNLLVDERKARDTSILWTNDYVGYVT